MDTKVDLKGWHGLDIETKVPNIVPDPLGIHFRFVAGGDYDPATVQDAEGRWYPCLTSSLWSADGAPIGIHEAFWREQPYPSFESALIAARQAVRDHLTPSFQPAAQKP